MFPHWNFVMFFYPSHICGSVVLFMSLRLAMSLLLWAWCHKVISHTAKFIFFTIRSEGEHKDTAITSNYSQALSIQQK
jgi:hypothetical protein